MQLTDKKILVTGGRGFLGSWVVEALKARGVPAENIFAPSSAECDLRRADHCTEVVQGKDVVIHIAARVGGIGANKAHPGAFFYENALMGIQLIEAARLAGVKKFVTIGTVCAYPENPPVPFKEEDLWNGYPTPATAPYGLAKKMLLVQGQAYREEYGFNAIFLLPTNLYGPRDDFDPETSHVIPSLIRRAISAATNGDPAVTLWGSGTATRDFLYVADAAEGIVRATEHYDGVDPVNLGSGTETSIRDLALAIFEVVGFTGEIRWDATKPDGQPRRCLDISRARSAFGFDPAMDFKKGLAKTIEWYTQNNS